MSRACIDVEFKYQYICAITLRELEVQTSHLDKDTNTLSKGFSTNRLRGL